MLFVSCDKAYRSGANIMILSDWAWMKTTPPSPHCLRSPPWSSTWRVSLMKEAGVVFKTEATANAEVLAAQYDAVVSCTGPRPKKESLVVFAIAEGKEKAAQADTELMGFTSIEI